LSTTGHVKITVVRCNLHNGCFLVDSFLLRSFYSKNRKNGSSSHFAVRRIVQRISDRTSVFLGGKLHRHDQRSSDYMDGKYIIIIFNNVPLRSIVFWFN